MTAFSKVLGMRLPWAASGDEASDAIDERMLGALYAAHSSDLRGFGRRLLGDPQAAEDLVHDVFVELPRALPRYRGTARGDDRVDGGAGTQGGDNAQGMRAFLRGIAVNLARRHIRGAVRRRQAMHRLATEMEHEAGFPRGEVERRVLARQLTSALDQLPLAQRVAFVLSEVEEMTAEEVGVLVGAPPATVRTRLFHARRKLRDALGGTA